MRGERELPEIEKLKFQMCHRGKVLVTCIIWISVNNHPKIYILICLSNLICLPTANNLEKTGTNLVKSSTFSKYFTYGSLFSRQFTDFLILYLSECFLFIFCYSNTSKLAIEKHRRNWKVVVYLYSFLVFALWSLQQLHKN